MNYWYGARFNEIFLDLDSRRAVNRALGVLKVAISQGLLDVQSVWLYPSKTPRHYHLIVMLKYNMDTIARLSWSLWMGNDRLRVAYVMQRMLWYKFETTAIDLLVASTPYAFRGHDAQCECKEKHKEKRVTDACPAMKEMLGINRSADYFGRTGHRPSNGKVRLPWGRVPLRRILRWKEPKNERQQKLLQDHGHVRELPGMG